MRVREIRTVNGSVEKEEYDTANDFKAEVREWFSNWIENCEGTENKIIKAISDDVGFAQIRIKCVFELVGVDNVYVIDTITLKRVDNIVGKVDLMDEFGIEKDEVSSDGC